jgi:fructose-bisphosphate aldolase class II
VNVGTALNIAYSGALRKSLSDKPDPRPYLEAGREAISTTVENLCRVVENAAVS